jgi:hypothetical protein
MKDTTNTANTDHFKLIAPSGGLGRHVAAFFVPKKIDAHQALASGTWLSFAHATNPSCQGQPISCWYLFAANTAHLVGPTHALVGLGF